MSTWIRNLFAEGIEPNPGPIGMTKFFDTVANQFDNVKIARDALANIEHIISDTMEKSMFHFLY